MKILLITYFFKSNVLTGIYAPTDGTAYIYNRDVRYEYNQIRKYVGICPQHDILFE
jgi:ABC-type multidrug transport system ATPase subunit